MDMMSKFLVCDKISFSIDKMTRIHLLLFPDAFPSDFEGRKEKVIMHCLFMARAFVINGYPEIFMSPYRKDLSLQSICSDISHETLHLVVALNEGWAVSSSMDNILFDGPFIVKRSILKRLQDEGYL